MNSLLWGPPQITHVETAGGLIRLRSDSEADDFKVARPKDRLMTGFGPAGGVQKYQPADVACVEKGSILEGEAHPTAINFCDRVSASNNRSTLVTIGNAIRLRMLRLLEIRLFHWCRNEAMIGVWQGCTRTL